MQMRKTVVSKKIGEEQINKKKERKKVTWTLSMPIHFT